MRKRRRIEVYRSGGKGGPQSFFHVRRQMPVGQGGFHVGGLRLLSAAPYVFRPPSRARRFTGAECLYVYDCGSEPKKHVYREIRNLLDCRPDRHLDILVLSHFDRDHICGTPRLLRSSDGFAVDTIILPFVDMDERIVALARAAASTEAFGGQIDSFFVDMVFKPTATLAAFGPRRIIFVRGDGDDGARGPGTAPDPDGDGGARSGGDPDGPMRVALKPAYPDDPQRPLEMTTLGFAGGSHVLEVRHAAAVIADPSWSLLWKLVPWVRPADPGAIAAFRAGVESLFDWKKGTFDARVTDAKVRKQMVTTKRTKLGQIYKAAFGDKNLTSLCLYSGLMTPEDFDAMALEPAMDGHDLTKIGWLGTGDTHLVKPADRAAFYHGYGADIDHASTFVFPHHGSIENSDPANLVSDADHWVAAADPIHDWEHPHWSLEEAVSTLARVFHRVRSPEATGFDEAFLVTPKLGP